MRVCYDTCSFTDYETILKRSVEKCLTKIPWQRIDDSTLHQTTTSVKGVVVFLLYKYNQNKIGDWFLFLSRSNMNKDRKERIIFHSITDIASSWNLEKAQELFKKIDINDDFSINDFLEFSSINEYFENGLFLQKWTEDEKNNYISLSEELFKKAILFFQNIIDEDILALLEELEFCYEKDFWKLVSKFKVYKEISPANLMKFLWGRSYCINNILKHKDIVYHFDKDVREFLIEYKDSWKLLLDCATTDSGLFFPKSLTHEDKENIIIKYMENDSGLFSNLEMIHKVGDWFLRLSSKTKLKAKQKYEKKNEDYFRDNDNIFKFWYKIGLISGQKESLMVEEIEDWLTSITYSMNFFDKIDFTSTPLEIFISLFWYVDDKWLIDLVSKESEIDLMEWLFSHWSRTDYRVSLRFRGKEMLSSWNLQTLEGYLKNNRNLTLEEVVNKYIENTLSKFEWLEKVRFQLDSWDMDYDKKIKLTIPDFDFLIKQYRCFVDEGNINLELIKIDSRPISYENIPSILPNKYFYELDTNLTALKYHFYSDQSWLFYIEGFENKYRDFYTLITKEELKISNFHQYQQVIINLLIKEGYLSLNKDDFIELKDNIFMFLVWEIQREWVLNYFSYSKEIRIKIEEMKDKKLIFAQSTLLSKQEADYFNYYLNKSKFLNWLDIRNKNIHWHAYESKNEAYADYLELFKIIILTLIKIDLELNINSD